MRRLQAEAPAAFQRLTQAYSQLKAEGQLTFKTKKTRSAIGFKSTESKTSLCDVTIAIADDREKVAVQFFTLDPAGEKQLGRDRVLCRSRTAEFTLDRGPKTQNEYVLSAMQSRREANQSQSGVGAMMNRYALLYARSPFKFHALTQYLITLDHAKMVSSESIKVDGQTAFRYRVANDPPGDSATSMMFELLPDHGWAIHHAEFETFASVGTGKQHRLVPIHSAITVEYGDDQQGLPVPRRVRSEDSLKEQVFEFRNVALGASTPEREFSMSYYGLPDATLPITVVNRPNYLLYGSFGLGAVSLVGSILLWKRQPPKKGVEG